MLNSSRLGFPGQPSFVLHTFLSAYIPTSLCLSFHPYASRSSLDAISLSLSLHHSLAHTSKEMSDEAAALLSSFRSVPGIPAAKTRILLTRIKPDGPQAPARMRGRRFLTEKERVAPGLRGATCQMRYSCIQPDLFCIQRAVFLSPPEEVSQSDPLCGTSTAASQWQRSVGIHRNVLGLCYGYLCA